MIYCKQLSIEEAKRNIDFDKDIYLSSNSKDIIELQSVLRAVEKKLPSGYYINKNNDDKFLNPFLDIFKEFEDKPEDTIEIKKLKENKRNKIKKIQYERIFSEDFNKKKHYYDAMIDYNILELIKEGEFNIDDINFQNDLIKAQEIAMNFKLNNKTNNNKALEKINNDKEKINNKPTQNETVEENNNKEVNNG